MLSDPDRQMAHGRMLVAQPRADLLNKPRVRQVPVADGPAGPQAVLGSNLEKSLENRRAEGVVRDADLA
jgi:hypothetical protein